MEKNTILIIDDSAINRAILSDILSDKYQILEAENGAVGLEQIEKNLGRICTILLDYTMPVMNGIEVLEVLKKRKIVEQIPIIIISSEEDSNIIENSFELGAQDYIMRPFVDCIVKRRVANIIVLFEEKRKLYEKVITQISETNKSKDLMVSILSHIVEYRNAESGLHVEHVKMITESILRTLKQLDSEKYNFSNEQIDLIANASALHDIGKIGIPEEILNKPGRLTDDEFAVIKTHSKLGCDIIDKIVDYKEEPLVKYSRDICLYHHEKWDGRGYPCGLKGNEIPIWAQAVSLADCYDALTAERCYKKAFTPEVATEMLLNGECGQFNPDIMEALKSCKDKLKEIVKSTTMNKMTSEERVAQSVEMFFNGFNTANEEISKIEMQRNRLSFLASLSEEIIMDYDVEERTIYVDEYGKNRFKIPAKIPYPEKNERVIAALGQENIDLIFNEIVPQIKETGKARMLVKHVRLNNKEYSFLVFFGAGIDKGTIKRVAMKAIMAKEKEIK